MKYDYLIVGAGLYGATFAYEASKWGKKCLVIDKRSHIGGNVYTEKVDGINIHKYGPHIFHTKNESIWRYINNFAAFNDFMLSPIAMYKGEWYNLPFNMNTFAKMWGVKTPEEAKEIISNQCNKIRKEPKNLEEQAISVVGIDIYEKLIKGYTEKQWGKECRELPAFIINRLPVRYTYNNNYFNDPFQGIPIGGYTKIIQKMLDKIDVQLNCNFFDQYRDYKQIADKLVYTGMIDEFYDYKFGELEYRSLIFEEEKINTDDYQRVAVINYTDKETKYTRVIEHKHFEKYNLPNTVITTEYPMPWTKGDEPYYPVNDKKNEELYHKYAKLNSCEIIFGGRLGMYKYLNMDQVIEMALNCVKEEM